MESKIYKNVVYKYKINESGKKEFVSAKFFTLTEDISVLEEEEFNKRLRDFAEQCGISVYDLILDNRLFKKVNISNKKADRRHKPTASDDEYVIPRGKKRKKKKLVKNLAVTATVIAVLGTGSYVVMDSISNNRKPIKFLSQYEEVIPTENPYEEPEMGYNGDGDYVQIEENNLYDYYNEMQNVNDRRESTNETISEMANSIENMDIEECIQSLDDISMLANCNMYEISDFINGSALNGSPCYNNFETNFSNEIDYQAVAFFSNARNTIVNAAYNDNNPEETIRLIRDLYATYTVFAVEGQALPGMIDDQDIAIDFSSLSPMAQATILKIMTAVLTIDCDYNYNSPYSDVPYSKDDIHDTTAILYDNALSLIENNSFSK